MWSKIRLPTMNNKFDITDLYNQHVDNLYTYALYLGFEKEVVKDAIHDVFCKLWEDNEDLTHVSNIKFYLFKSLKNRLLNIYKSKRDLVEIDSALNYSSNVSFDFNVTTDEQIISEEDRNIIENKVKMMLGSLTERQREAIYLRYILEYDYPQIAEMLDISVHGCRKLVSRAITSLREMYGKSTVFLLLFI